MGIYHGCCHGFPPCHLPLFENIAVPRWLLALVVVLAHSVVSHNMSRVLTIWWQHKSPIGGWIEFYFINWITYPSLFLCIGLSMSLVYSFWYVTSEKWCRWWERSEWLNFMSTPDMIMKNIWGTFFSPYINIILIAKVSVLLLLFYCYCHCLLTQCIYCGLS